MRADLQNYLIAKSQGLVGNTSSARKTGRYGSNMKSMSSTHSYIAPTLEGQIDIRSDRLTKNTPVMAAQVKALHDSCYVQPEKNPRVIQDTNPVKSNAWRDALQRHENSVAQQKGFNETVMKKHYQQIKSDTDVIDRENETRRQKQ